MTDIIKAYQMGMAAGQAEIDAGATHPWRMRVVIKKRNPFVAVDLADAWLSGRLGAYKNANYLS